MQPSTEVTQLLRRWREGDPEALERLLPLVYEELRRLARRYMLGEREGHTLEATALVHEAYLRLVESGGVPWADRVHFYAVAAQVMRRVLVDHARGRDAAKRGGSFLKVPLDEARDAAAAGTDAPGLLALDEALTDLEVIDPRKSRVIELRYFGGLSLEETAEALGVSVPLVVKEARLARAWLHHRMTGVAGGG